MDTSYQRFTNFDTASRILEVLTEEQFIRPHRPLAEALDAAGKRAGFCPDAGRRALAHLNLDRTSAIGRLRRTELNQLARAIHRLWRQGVVEDSPQSQTV